MSKSSRIDDDGSAVEVSLLKLKPVTLALSAACLITLISLFSWVGFAGGGQLVASKTVRNHAANQDFRESPTIPNSATSQDAKLARDNDAAVVEEPADSRAASETAAVEVEENPASGVARTADDSTLAPEPAGAAGVPGGGGYAVQAGSFSTVSDANERVSSLRAAGFEARVAAVEIAKRGTWYRVYSGRFESREDASLHDKKLRASGAVADTMVTAVQE